jgi:hypothetical protein
MSSRRPFQAHYTDNHGERRAVLIFEADRSSELSKRPGTSYRGVIEQIEHGRLSLAADTRTHAIELVKKTRRTSAGAVTVTSPLQLVIARRRCYGRAS